jgi:hypothetical protein
MRGILAVLILWAVFAGSQLQGEEMLVAASIRQYQLIGASNIHLYLYGLDGRLKKQLTSTAGCDDLDPAFSCDGQSLYFIRKSTLPSTTREKGLYKLDLVTNTISRASEDDYFCNIPMETLEYSFALPADSWNVSEKAECLSLDGKYCITIQSLSAKAQGVNPPTRHFLSVSNGPLTDMATLSGFMPTDQVDGYESLEQLNGTPFVTGPDFQAVFLVHHLDSTDGDQIWGLDLQTRKWTKMSENGGTIYHPPGAGGVFFAEESLYEPLGGQTVNCCYLEWWNAHLQMTKLSPPLSFFYSAAIFHGENETLRIRPGQ